MNLAMRPATACALCIWAVAAVVLARLAERRTSGCRRPFPWRCAALAAAAAVVAVYSRPNAPAGAMAGVASIALIAGSGADHRTGYLFDAVMLPAACIVAGIAIAFGTAGDAAAGVFLLVGPFGSLVLASRGRWLGLGDVKAMYVIGAAFGPLQASIVVCAACLSGILTCLVRGKFARRAEVPFGPHLAAASVFVLCAGEPIARAMGL